MLGRFLWDVLLPVTVIGVAVVGVDRYRGTHLVDYVTEDTRRGGAFALGALVVLTLTAGVV